MKGDFTRITHSPAKHYTQVLKQQGRVGVDADDNEQAAIDDRLRRTTTLDVVGPSGAPKDGGGFKVQVDAATGAMQVSKGRLYVEGALCELEADAAYDAQLDYPSPPAYLPPASGERTDVVYVDAWDRHVTAIEDPHVMDPALGGVDTATRVRTIAQVKVLVGADATSCARPGDLWKKAIRPSGARLSSKSEPSAPGDDPCLVVEGGGYRGLENRLYRVEVHDGGEPYAWPRSPDAEAVDVVSLSGSKQVNVAAGAPEGRAWAPGQWIELFSDRTQANAEKGLLARVESVSGTLLTLSQSHAGFASDAGRKLRRVATWKWSRDNGSIAYPRDENDEETDVDKITVATAGRDDAMRIRKQAWVEVLGDKTELLGLPGTLAQVDDVSATRVVTLLRDISAHKGEARVKLRRWDQDGDAIPAVVGKTEALEDGVQVVLGGERFRTGDHWSFAARTAEADVERLVDAPPQGIRHRYARLALVKWSHSGGARSVSVRDCRDVFLPLTRQPDCCTVTVGNGFESHGEFDTVQAAVDALPDSGGCVRILAGDHLLDDPVIVQRNGVRLVGCGTRTRLVAQEGEPAVLVRQAERCAVENLVLAATSSDLGALVLSAARRFRLEGCQVGNQSSEGAKLGEEPAILAVDAGGVTCADLEIVENVIAGNLGASIRARGVRFAGNRLPQGGLWLRTGTRDADVRDNRIGAEDGAPGWGILLGGQVADDPEDPDVWTRERTAEPETGGAWLGGAATRFLGEGDMPMQDITIERNRILGMGEAGVGWRLMGGMRRLRLVENAIEGCAREPTDFVGAGVLVAACDDLLLRGNRVRRNGADRRTFGVLALGCRAVVMEGNRVTDNGVRTEPPREEAQEAQPQGEAVYVKTLSYVATDAPQEEDADEDDSLPFQAAVVVAAFGGLGMPALEMRGNLFACPRGPALLAGVAGSGAITDNELLARGSWALGRFLRGHAVVAAAMQGDEYDLQGRLRLEGNRIAWDADGPPEAVPARFGQIREAFASASAARAVYVRASSDVSFEGNHVRMDAEGWPRLAASVEAQGESVRAVGNRFEEPEDQVSSSYWAHATRAMNLALGNQAEHCIRLTGESPMNVHNQEIRCESSQVSNTHVEDAP